MNSYKNLWEQFWKTCYVIRQNLNVFSRMYCKLSPESGNNLSSLNSVAEGKKWMITHQTLMPLRSLSISSLWGTVTLPQPWEQTSLIEIQRSLDLNPRSVHSVGSQEDAADLKVPDFQMMGFSFYELELQRVKIHSHAPKVTWLCLQRHTNCWIQNRQTTVT